MFATHTGSVSRWTNSGEMLSYFTSFTFWGKSPNLPSHYGAVLSLGIIFM